MARPTVTWAELQIWARHNKVPDNARVEDQEGRAVNDLSYRHGRLTVIFWFNVEKPMTWADIKERAKNQNVTGDSVLIHSDVAGDGHSIVDLSVWEEEPGDYRLSLQTRWG